MEESERKYGLLINPDTKIYRKYFEEMCRLLGVRAKYYSVKPDKHWTTYAELETNYNPPIEVGCVFEQYPEQSTMKKIGWTSELDKQASVIHLAYDTPNLQVGCLVEIPGALDTAKARLFRISKLSTTMIYPSSITCLIVPEYETKDVPELRDFSQASMTMLKRDEDDEIY